MPEGTGNSRSEHGAVGKGNGTDAKGNRSDGSKSQNDNDTKKGGLGSANNKATKSKNPNDMVDIGALIDEAEKTGRVKTVNPGQKGPTMSKQDAARFGAYGTFEDRMAINDTLASMQDDAANVGNSALENAANAAASFLGISERAPTLDDAISAVENAKVNNTTPDARASWGWDLGQTVADVVGAVTGAPFGTGYGVAKRTLGFAGFTVDLGPDVFGGNPPSSGASSYDGGTISGNGSFFGGNDLSGSYASGDSKSNSSSSSTGGKGAKDDGNNDHSDRSDTTDALSVLQSSNSSGAANSSSNGSNAQSQNGANTIDSILEQLLTANLTVPPFQKPASYSINMAPHDAVMQMIADARSK